jgi:peptidoglycan LD-endopeptidase LytH
MTAALIYRQKLVTALRRNRRYFAPVVNFTVGKDKIIPLCFTRRNRTLTEEIFSNTDRFCTYIRQLLRQSKARYGIGGYNELRNLYGRSNLFNAVAAEEPRRLHLGTDIWGKAGEKVYAPMDGTIHSFAFNNHYGDYGATIILRHELAGLPFHTLYGHCSLADLDKLETGKPVKRGQLLASFGKPEENGYWPPHLHFQLVTDMDQYRGDYPGVCAASKKKGYLCNSPQPNYVLNLNQWITDEREN